MIGRHEAAVPTVDAAELAKLLNYTGAEPAVQQAVERAGYEPKSLTQDECDRVLQTLGGGAGVNALSARFARAQVPLLFADKIITEPARRRRHSKRQSASSTGDAAAAKRRVMAFAAKKSFSKGRLVQMFSAGMPEDMAERAVRLAAAAVGTRETETFGLDELDHVLDAVADQGQRWASEVQLVRARLRGGSSF